MNIINSFCDCNVLYHACDEDNNVIITTDKTIVVVLYNKYANYNRQFNKYIKILKHNRNIKYIFTHEYNHGNNIYNPKLVYVNQHTPPAAMHA